MRFADAYFDERYADAGSDPWGYQIATAVWPAHRGRVSRYDTD